MGPRIVENLVFDRVDDIVNGLDHGHAGSLHVLGQQPHERGDEDAHHHHHALYASSIPDGFLWHELLSTHFSIARLDGTDRFLPGPGFDGRHSCGDVPLDAPPSVDVDRGTQVSHKKFSGIKKNTLSCPPFS